MGEGGLFEGRASVKELTRNQKIILDFEHGYAIEKLMRIYGLRRDRIQGILREERNKRLVSPLSFYRALRDDLRESVAISS